MHDPHHDNSHSSPLRPMAGELVADYRERLARRELEARERQAHELAEQSSTLNSPADRIRIWERRHGLTLPTSPSHRLLDIVATGTGLDLDAVLAEQRRRRTPQDAASAPLVETSPASTPA